MCSSPKPPDPVAPPSPIPMRDTRMDARAKDQSRRARMAAGGNAESMQLTGAGGDTSKAPTASPVLGV